MQGGLCSVRARPGSLQRNLHTMRSENRSIQKSQTSCISSCPRRNAITSSYSSTRGFPSVQRRRGPATSHTGLPRMFSKKVSEEGPGSPSAASGLSLRKTQRGKDAEATTGQTQTQRNGWTLPGPENARLLCCHIGEGSLEGCRHPLSWDFESLWKTWARRSKQHCGPSTVPCRVTLRPSGPVAPHGLPVLSPRLLQGLLLHQLALPSLILVPLPPPACQSLLLAVPAPQPAHLQAWLPSQLLTLSPPWTPLQLPSLSSWGLPLAPVGASSHLPRPSRCPPVTVWTQSPPACLH
uniref:Uncharacterized protein n=1 Tax=Equus caballus TaxID=9796 RepID=A0A9L0SQV7_HORSE